MNCASRHERADVLDLPRASYRDRLGRLATMAVMENLRSATGDEKLPRGHAYIRMRNRRYSIHIDFREIDSDLAQRMSDAAMATYREAIEKDQRSDGLLGLWTNVLEEAEI